MPSPDTHHAVMSYTHAHPQAVYHMGPLTASDPPRPLWRAEWEVPGSVLDTLTGELSSLADRLADSIRESDSVLLLGELAGFLSDWHALLRDTARRFAAMAEAWADGLEGDVKDAEPDAAREVRARQCMCRATALLCHGGGVLDADDVARVLRLAVQVHHGMACKGGTSFEQRLPGMQVRHQHVCTRTTLLVAKLLAA